MKMPTGNVWVSPQRDLVYCLPAYIKMALDLFSKENTTDEAVIKYRELMEKREKNGDSSCDGNKLMSEVAHCLINYISNCKDFNEKDVHTVLNESGYYSCDFATRMLFEHLLFRVIFSGYYYGVKEAGANENQNFIYMTPKDLIQYSLNK